PEAIDDVRRSAELADQLFSQRPDLTDARRIDATEHRGLAEFLRDVGDLPGALAHLRRSIQMREPLLLNPVDAGPRPEQSAPYAQAAEIELRQGNCSAALPDFRMALQLSADPAQVGRIRQTMAKCESR